MNETLVPILLYIFEHHMHENELQTTDVEELMTDLHEAGFEHDSCIDAIRWLHEILALHEAEAMHTNVDSEAMRIFTPEEIVVFSSDVRGYILYLVSAGILNAVTREKVINRLANLNASPIEVEHVKLVTMLVLENDQDNNPSALYSMEELLMAQEVGGIH